MKVKKLIIHLLSCITSVKCHNVFSYFRNALEFHKIVKHELKELQSVKNWEMGKLVRLKITVAGVCEWISRGIFNFEVCNETKCVWAYYCKTSLNDKKFKKKIVLRCFLRILCVFIILKFNFMKKVKKKHNLTQLNLKYSRIIWPPLLGSYKASPKNPSSVS